MKIILFVTIFLLTGAFFIIANENLRMSSSENIDSFVYGYVDWISGLLKNSNSLAGFLIKLEWLPDTGLDNVSINDSE